MTHEAVTGKAYPASWLLLLFRTVCHCSSPLPHSLPAHDIVTTLLMSYLFPA
jgi:hypothetical protein